MGAECRCRHNVSTEHTPHDLPACPLTHMHTHACAHLHAPADASRPLSYQTLALVAHCLPPAVLTASPLLSSPKLWLHSPASLTQHRQPSCSQLSKQCRGACKMYTHAAHQALADIDTPLLAPLSAWPLAVPTHVMSEQHQYTPRRPTWDSQRHRWSAMAVLTVRGRLGASREKTTAAAAATTTTTTTTPFPSVTPLLPPPPPSSSYTAAHGHQAAQLDKVCTTFIVHPNLYPHWLAQREPPTGSQSLYARPG